MTVANPVVKYRTLTANEIRIFQRDGYLILNDVMPQVEIDALNDEMEIRYQERLKIPEIAAHGSSFRRGHMNPTTFVSGIKMKHTGIFIRILNVECRSGYHYRMRPEKTAVCG